LALSRGYSSRKTRKPEQLAFDLASVPPPRRDLAELWTPDDIFAAAQREGVAALTRFPEDNRIEWKSVRYEPKDLADYLSMWANTQPYGGLIAVGIEKTAAIGGCIPVGLDRVSELERTGTDHCPDALYDTRRIPATRPDGVADFVLLFRVYYRPDKLVETVRHEAFVRIGNTKRRLTEDEKREIRINKGQIEYEKERVGLRYPADFDDLLIRQFCDQYREKRGLTAGHSREKILYLNHLGSMADGELVPNLACALLFAMDPRNVIPGARIRFMRFEGTEEKTGQQYNCVKDVFVEGPLPTIIQEAEQVIAGQIRNFTRLGTDGKFYTRPEYPLDAWREAVINACVHRSYNLRNMNIFIKMFDDRLVIESPGGFPPPVTPQNIYDTHNPRNPHLMNALFYFEYVKCANEGTRRMRDMMIGANLPAPEFSQREVGTHQVHVTMRNNIDARKEFVEAGALKIIGENVYEQLSQLEKQVINYIAEHQRLNVSDANRLLQKD
jgi:ATP-dependent DNA helicase RecG